MKQLLGVRKSLYSSLASYSTSTSKEILLLKYENLKKKCLKIVSFDDKIERKGVFANNEISLKDIDVYGFDYDYTLAYYNVSLYRLIFNLAKDYLIEHHKYPVGLKSTEYLPHFPIRGLHLDIKKGWLMKIDSYHNLQLGTVYHGMNSIPNEEVLKTYGGKRFSIEDIGFSQTSPNFHHFVDLFCLPEICLLACTFQYLIDRGINFRPEYIFHDVHDSVNSIHRNFALHRSITQSIDDYLLQVREENSKVKEFLYRLQKNGKKVFLITNSPYWFVNFGMQSLCGSDWTSLFDLIICSARKPQFFTSKSKPFRRFNIKTNSKSWDTVSELNRNEVYYEGNFYEMLKATGWQSNKCLYFGDHIYGDLEQPFLKFGLRTAAIINEVEQEVNIINSLEYLRTTTWLNSLENLIEHSMFVSDTPGDNLPSLEEIRTFWFQEREILRKKIKKSFNPYFGSIFRANNNPSFFSRRLSRFADIYTSNVSNLLNYPIDYHFIPRRIDLAHEQSTRVKMASATLKFLNIDYEIFGKVQGVFFRKYTQQEGKKLGLVGWVMNTEKGSVVGQIQGKEDAVKKMKDWLRKTGSPKCRIDRAEFKNEKFIDKLDFSAFDVRK
ncbi:unnamed protein product [Brachionus calyciflorus]|uniref:acylphosphatase n=1 Tax=Brachionus calyciflorus TaxID=104777 RepID=A0A814AWK7_9BILA|nr:unnamed protein product [Brachionus calyciflorus]